ncbi:MAG: cardiolipin synthase [Eubacteriales bacterium]|nr:cardiolipin synthase [Eubacteriales bacterium]MDD3350547.1 cardiolipin synthase [Eubacteriales bacterium]
MFLINLLEISTLPVIIYSVNFLIAFVIIFLERKNPSASLAWIMVLFMLPGFGILFYAFFSQHISRQKIFHLTDYEHHVLNQNLEAQISSIRSKDFAFNNNVEKKWQDMILLHQTYSKAFLTQNNRVFLLTDGNHKFQSLLQDIKAARKSINVMYFIIKNDFVGQALIQALTEKAKEGVKVRLLLDAMGCRQIRHKQLAEFKKAGGMYAYFFPPKLKFLNLKLNYRNHRKLVIIDGEIGYLGGFNIAKEYLGQKKKFGYWRDTHLRLMGNCVQDMNARFILDWRFAKKEDLRLESAYFGTLPDMGETGIQIVSCGPDSRNPEIKRGYLKMITSAKKNIFIQSPYFVPDSSIIESLKNAIYSGVDVRIMIPDKPDHFFVYWATMFYVGDLLRAGAKIYIYRNGFLHAKNICVDGEVASVGSANFDMRSFYLNFEINAFIYDAEEVYKLESIFEEDMAVCEELTEKNYNARPITVKVKESISRLLSDLL